MEIRAIENGKQTETEENMIDLGILFAEFLKVLERFWWLAAGIVAACTVIYSVYVYVNYTPMYQCQATFTVSTGDEESGSYGYYYSQETADQLSKTFPYILDSNYFKQVLLDALDAKKLNGTLSAETVSTSNIVTITVESKDAKDAEKILKMAVRIYPETARFVLGNIQFYMMNEPETPKEPYNRPSLIGTVGYGIGIGLIVGVIVIGILVFTKRCVKTPEEMERISSLKCVAAIPRIRMKARKSSKQERLSILGERADFGYKESIRSMQIRLDRALNGRGGESKVILVTSTLPNEGKSTIAVNLAEMYASQGKKVLLIDGDLRKQEDAQLLGCGDGEGLQDIIEKNEKNEKSPDIRWLEKENFWFLGSERPIAKPAKILSHPWISDFIEAMKKNVDYIIIDTPPSGIFQDALLIKENADAILYVVRHDYVSFAKLREGLSAFDDGKETYIGYVFNSYAQGIGEYGYGRYGYGYGRYGYGKYGYGKYGYGKNGYGSEESDKEENQDD